MENPAVVIDNGTGMMKTGLSGEEAPSHVFPTLVGIPKHPSIVGGNNQELYIAGDALEHRGLLKLKYPIEHGVVNEWEHMKKLWRHTYENELRIDPETQPVLLTEAPLNPNANREKMMEFFFDELNVPAFYVFTQAVLSLYSSGKTTGLVVDSGDGVTHIVVVYEAYSIKHAVNRMDLAGRDLTNYLQKLLTEIGVTLKSSADFEIAREIKEKTCYIALDYEQEEKALKEKKIEYTMPDNSVIEIGPQAIKCPELLFKPDLNGYDFGGIQDMVIDSIKKCDMDLRKNLYSNITLSGGTTTFEGIQERLNKEISAMAPPNTPVRIIAPVERKYSVWIGGSVLSSLATFQTSWITRDEYREEGASVVHRKCF